MTDSRAKIIAITLVRQWAEESGDDICQECGGLGYVYEVGHAFADALFCEHCRGTGQDERYSIERFQKWLDRATEIVESWPEWKRVTMAEIMAPI